MAVFVTLESLLKYRNILVHMEMKYLRFFAVFIIC